MAQFVVGEQRGCEDHVDLDWLENREVGLMRRRVIPPNEFNVHPSQAPSPNVSQQPQFPFADSEELPGPMDSRGYFTGLMTNGFGLPGQFENLPPAQDVASQEEVQETGKGNQRRSKNFTIQEGEQLVKAWLNVSLDPVKGVDQSRDTYWKRIHAYFHAHKDFSSDHTEGSLINRWSGILRDVNLFAGCLSKIEGRNQSGATIDDKQADALKLFIKEDKQHRQFPYMHCWKLLKDQPKWADRRKQMQTQKTITKKQKVSANSSPGSAPLVPTAATDDNQLANSTPQRPTGQKKEKQKLRQHSTMEALDYLLSKKKEADAEKELKKEERCKKAFALQEERIRLEKEKLELQRNQFEFNKNLEEERIMNVDTSNMSNEQMQYYESLKNAILASRLSN